MRALRASRRFDFRQWQLKANNRINLSDPSKLLQCQTFYYIPHKTRKPAWSFWIHDFLLWGSFYWGIWLYKTKVDTLSLQSNSLYRRNLLKKGSLWMEVNHRWWRVKLSHEAVHERHHKWWRGLVQIVCWFNCWRFIWLFVRWALLVFELWTWKFLGCQWSRRVNCCPGSWSFEIVWIDILIFSGFKQFTFYFQFTKVYKLEIGIWNKVVKE